MLEGDLEALVQVEGLAGLDDLLGPYDADREEDARNEKSRGPAPPLFEIIRRL